MTLRVNTFSTWRPERLCTTSGADSTLLTAHKS